MNKMSPILLVILGLLAGVPAARMMTGSAAAKADAPPAKTEPSAPAEPLRIEAKGTPDPAVAGGETCKADGPKGVVDATGQVTVQSSQSSLPAWCMPVRLLREFFSLPAAAEKQRGDCLRDVVAQANATSYDLRFMVALVPALPDPRMDQALDAIQRAFSSSKNRLPGGFPPEPDDYLLDRAWLPWAGASPGTAKPAASAPGILLFRGSKPHALEVVFVIPETSKMGIQKDTFRQALDLIAGLQGASVEPTVAILGPSFSGSVESLRVALSSWSLGRSDPLSFRAASGSASADDLETVFDELQVSFCRVMLPDSVLQVNAFRFLHQEMGWNLREVGLLVEDDTQYGQSFVSAKGVKDMPVGGEAVGQNLVLLTFPSHLSDLRNAWEDEQKAQPASPANPLPATRRALSLALSGHEQEADLVPTFSATTTSINDLLLSNLLQTIAREGLRYVGIVSTDPMDKLFLAEKLRQLAPDVVLFTFDNNLLYAHPDHAVELDGILVLGSYPLFTEGAPGLPSVQKTRSRDEKMKWESAAKKKAGGDRWQLRGERRQFGSEYQEGVFEAARYLLGASPQPQPQAWIAAVGNGSLWPIAVLQVDPRTLKTARFCGQEPDQASTPKEKKLNFVALQDAFDGKDDLQILLVAGLFCLLAIGLRRAALLDKVPDAPLDPDDHLPVHDARGNRALLAAGLALLAAATGILLAVATIPLWSQRWSARESLGIPVSQWIYLLFLVTAYGWLVSGLARAAHGVDPGRRPGFGRIVVWTLGALAAVALLILATFWLCVPGDQTQLFYLRVRAFSSGLSPLVPLAVAGGAIYVWLWNELKRRRLLVRLASDCPLDSLGDPAVAGCEPMIKAIRRLLNRTWPRGLADGEAPPWILPAVAFLPPAVLLWGTVQPIGEARPFGRLFILLILAAYALSALSFYRFVRLWWETRRILHRLDSASPAMAAAFEAIGKVIDWRPIKSFGWQIPPFRSLMLSVQTLRELVAAEKVVVPRYPGSVDSALEGMFASERPGGAVAEIENRLQLERILAQACLDLRGEVEDPEVKKFLALRIAAYLRFVFAHLRSCLIGALLSGLLALIAVTAYAFEPKHLVSLIACLALALAVVLTLLIFFQMDRNPTLSRIGDTTAGHVDFDIPFVTKLVTYAGIPLLGLIATQFPEVGALLSRVAGQFLRVVGGG
jgi:hypothetical protein